MDKMIFCRLCGAELETECEKKYKLCDNDLTLISEMSTALKPFIMGMRGGK